MQRAFDIFLCLILMPFIIIHMAIIAMLILLVDRYNPYFSQPRIGYLHKEFTCYKFRTMKHVKDPSEYHNPEFNKMRVTKLGLFLKDMGWDETPQIFNILKGDMSFIGPRPVTEIQLTKLKTNYPQNNALLDEWWKRRHQVKPGLSGWHQINLQDPNVVKYDLEYLNNPNIKKKLKILMVSIVLYLTGKKLYFRQDFPVTFEHAM